MSRKTTADTPLTVKQTRFAAAVASGKPRTVALRENYVPPDVPNAQCRRAKHIAERPNVAAEIRRLTWLSCPPVDDVRGMREHAVRVLSDLSRSAASEDVRLKSALALYRIAETTLAAANPRAEDAEQDRLLASLRKLYVEVQGQADKPHAMRRPSPGGDDDPLGPDPAGGVRSRLDDDPIDITALAIRTEPAPQEPAEPEPQEAQEPAADPAAGPLPVA